MYAIVEAGGCQHRVSPGEVVTFAGAAAETGREFTLTTVLLVEEDGGRVIVGAPYVPNARVTAYAAADPVPGSSWRSVGASFSGFLHESLLDERAM